MQWLRSLTNNMRCTTCLANPPNSVEEEEEVENLKLANKRKSGGWKCMPYIIGNETFEKLASTGLMANFTVYLVKHYRMEQVAAANMANIYFGTTNFAPLVGAFISDAYIGRFNTIAYSSVASLLVSPYPPLPRWARAALHGLQPAEFRGIIRYTRDDVNEAKSSWTRRVEARQGKGHNLVLPSKGDADSNANSLSDLAIL